jgi:integrase/recombinase XerD
LAAQVLAIPVKRADRKLVGYLSRDEIVALLAAPDRAAWSGRRDHALLLTLYNSGARVSEVTALRRDQVHVGTGPHLELHGKGCKERVLQACFRDLGDRADAVAFPSARGQPLSRDGVDFLLRRAVSIAAQSCPSLEAKRVSPHVLRDTTAMHRLQAGVDVAVIAL